MKTPAILLLTAALCTGCGGSSASSGGGGGSANAPSCGTSFAVPNYVTENDPGTGSKNVLMWWRSFPLKVAFVSPFNLDLGAGESISTTLLINDAIKRWGDSTGGEVRFQTVSASDSPDIRVTTEQLASRPGPGARLGATRLTFNPDTKEMAFAEITLYVWPGMTRNEILDGFQASSLHEFGHALFLNGHSEAPDDVMAVSSKIDEDRFPTARDANTLRTAYCGTYSREAAGRSKGRLVTEAVKCPR